MNSKYENALRLGIKDPIKEDFNILYLGASHGTTVSIISKKIKGYIFAVEISKALATDLIKTAEAFENIIPILADASQPHSYKEFIPLKVDLIYEDLAQKNQVEILIKNLIFLKPKGTIILCIKARAINSTGPLENIFKEELKKLEDAGIKITQTTKLEPYEKDHLFLVGTYL